MHQGHNKAAVEDNENTEAGSESESDEGPYVDDANVQTDHQPPSENVGILPNWWEKGDFQRVWTWEGIQDKWFVTL